MRTCSGADKAMGALVTEGTESAVSIVHKAHLHLIRARQCRSGARRGREGQRNAAPRAPPQSMHRAGHSRGWYATLESGEYLSAGTDDWRSGAATVAVGAACGACRDGREPRRIPEHSRSRASMSR